MNSTLSGVTKYYSGNGRKLGYPTANIATKTDLKDGVYFGFATVSHYTHHPALIFIGTPITVGDRERRVEAHLLDIDDNDLYDQDLSLQVQHFHRLNQKFASIDDLKIAIKQDEQAVRAWLEQNST